MRFFLFPFLFFLGLAFLGSAQSPQIDSLQRLIDGEGNTKRKVELLNQLSLNFFGYDIEMTGVTTQSAVELSQKMADKQGEGWALAYRGVYFLFIGDLTSANENLNSSLRIGQVIQDVNLQTYSSIQLGNVFRDKGVFDSAFYFYRQAENVLQIKPDQYYQSVIKMNKGRCYLILNKPDSALVEGQEALKLRLSLKNQGLITDVWLLLGNCYLQKSELTEAEQYYNMVLKASSKSSSNYVGYLRSMGEVYFLRGDFQKALENWTQVLAFHRKLNYRYEIASLLDRMGEGLVTQGYYDLANEYLLRGLDICEKSSYQFLRGKILHQLTWVSFRIKNQKTALANSLLTEEIFLKLDAQLELAGTWDLRGLIYRELKKYDSALLNHKKGLDVRLKIGNKVDISASLFNIGEFFLLTNQLSEALPYYSRSLVIDTSIGDLYGQSLNFNRIGNIYLQQDVLDSAKIYLDKSMKLSIPTSAMEILRDNYLDLATYLVKKGKPLEAIEYYKQHNQITDSLFDKQTSQSLASYRALYDVERNVQQIELLSKDNQISKAQVQKQRIILFTAVAGSIILLALSVFYYRFSLRQKKLNVSLAEKNNEIQAQSKELVEANEALSNLNKEIAEQREEIQAQAEELTESNQTIMGINEKLEERIESRTSELKQAFKELDTFFYRSSHDFRRPLTTFMGLAEVAKIVVKDAAALELFEKVNENAHSLDKMLGKMQTFSNIGSEELVCKEVFVQDIFDLVALKYEDDLKKKNIQLLFNVKITNHFISYPASIVVIMENLVENAIHFSATRNPFIELNAFEKDGEVVLQVADNGQGIEEQVQNRIFEMYFRGNERSKGNGLGLFIVKKVVAKLGGRILFQTQLHKGSVFSVFLPNLS